MLKLCGSSISKLLSLLFKHILEKEWFPNEWKKALYGFNSWKRRYSVDWKLQTGSILSICGKILEKIIFNSLFKSLECNKLLNHHQSGFSPVDSCFHHFLPVSYNIYKVFDANPSREVKVTFLDMPRAFDRLWHAGFLFKLKRLGLSGKFYGLVYLFLCNRHQRLVLNGQSSKWTPIGAGGLRGSILGLLFFFVYINDLPKE